MPVILITTVKESVHRCKGTRFHPSVLKIAEGKYMLPDEIRPWALSRMKICGAVVCPPAALWGNDMSYFEIMSDFQSLYEAHTKSRLGKRNQDHVILFELNLGEELIKLSEELKNYSYRLGGYRHFTVHDPKTREIQALGYRDRVVQHSLCDNVLRPLIEPKLIYDNSACRIGKGTHFSMERLSGFMRDYYKRNGADGYVLKFDIRKYFDSIHHQVLKRQIMELTEEREIIGLLYMIINSYETTRNRGLPMGNQTSQWFGIYYLNGLDHYIKEQMRIRYYTRYMDDGIIIHSDKEYLRKCLVNMQKYVEDNLGLQFNEKTQIMPLSQGVDYLGFHFYLTDTGKVMRKLRQSGKKRLKKKLRAYRRAYRYDKIESDAVRRSLCSYRGHLSHGHTYRLRKNIYDNLVLTKNKHDEGG